MARSQESYNKKEVRNKKEKKRKEKEQKRQARKDSGKSGSLDDMIAYVDENGMITSTPPDSSKKTEVKLEDILIAVPKKQETDEENTRRLGTVSYFNHAKGYGFIRDHETRESIFVHVQKTLEEIREGNTVSYEIGRGPKGPTALNVKLNRPEQ